MKKQLKPKYIVIHSTGEQPVYSASEAGTVVRMMLLDGFVDIKIKKYC